MAAKKYFSNLDLNKNQIRNAILENTTSAIADAATPVEGQIIYDTGSNVFKYFDGTVWQAPVSRFEGQIIYKGSIPFDNAVIDIKEVGDLYLFNSPGQATNFGNVLVSAGDYIIWSGTSWRLIQGNIIDASLTVSGVVKLSTLEELNLGTAGPLAITPFQLKEWETQTDDESTLYGKSLVRKSIYTIDIDNDGEIINDFINIENPIVSVYHNGQKVELEISKINGTIILKSDTPLAGAKVIISG